jgi:hypothetical protein
MNVLRLRSWAVALATSGKLVLEELQSSFDMDISWVQVSSTAVGVQSISDLVVAGLVESSQIVPNL